MARMLTVAMPAGLSAFRIDPDRTSYNTVINAYASKTGKIWTKDIRKILKRAYALASDLLSL